MNRGKLGTLLATILGSGVVFIDVTVVNVALPRIGQDLPGKYVGILEGQSYVYNGYLLTLSALLILAGALNDYYGRRRMFAVGLGGFGVTSLLCGLAPTMELLILFRLLQGAAGALLVPGSLSIITAAFGGEERGRVIGLWAGASGATTILGPVLGGLLVDNISWRMAFLINVPVVALALWATVAYVRETRDEGASGRFDWFGALLVALAVGGLTFGAIYGQQREWREALGFGALAVGAVATLILPAWMARAANPLVPLGLFRSRNFTITNLSTLLIYGALYVQLYYTAIYLQGTLGYSAAATGLAMIPGFLLMVFFSPRFGALAGRLGPRWFMASGPAIMGAAILWFMRVPVDSAPLLLEGSGALGVALVVAGVAATWVALTPPLQALARRLTRGGVAGPLAWALLLLPAGLALVLGFALGIGAPATRGYFVDLLPAFLGFGVGVTIMVAPLTTALMASVPVQNSGVASAFNNAISRVGPQLVGALIFVAITANFYDALAVHAPGLDVTSAQVRAQVSPLNRPPATVSTEQASAIRLASTDAFHLAMLVAAALCLSGAAVSAAGIQNPQPAPARALPSLEPTDG